MTRGSETPDPDKIIEQMLDDLAAEPMPDPSDDLMKRVLADAAAHLPPPGGAPAAVPWWRELVQGIGGWGAIGGLVAATVAGFAIGLGALDATGVDAVWTLGYGENYGTELGLDAFGWALEEG
ncbi:hypothetical protein KUV51_03365 [Tateyamaria omphalii]|uniref:hypothetical protein n=1 Tax=Tateyamaria omphalii TaxID=299262 RepID=UPI001C99EAEE|nr:hypothetical protein [Tateyamaria omphalii]MBY5932028.1 hypothetical protein [Tateyamaria omphalii]